MNKFVLPGQDDPIWNNLKAAIQDGFRYNRHGIETLFEVPKELRTGYIEVDSISLDCGVDEGQFWVKAAIILDFQDNGLLHPDGVEYKHSKSFNSEPEWGVLYTSIDELFSKSFELFADDVDGLYFSIRELRKQLVEQDAEPDHDF